MKTNIFTLLTCLFAASSMHASKLWNISDSQFTSLGTATTPTPSPDNKLNNNIL